MTDHLFDWDVSEKKQKTICLSCKLPLFKPPPSFNMDKVIAIGPKKPKKFMHIDCFVNNLVAGTVECSNELPYPVGKILKPECHVRLITQTDFERRI